MNAEPAERPPAEGVEAVPRACGARTLLIVYHSQTGGTRQMAEAAAAGAEEQRSEAPSLSVCLRNAPDASAADVLCASGFLFATPENLGAMSGLLKDFFDRTYYAALDRINGRPYAVMVCAGTDGTNAVRQIDRVATGWRLRPVAPPLIVRTGAQTPEDIARPKTLGAADLERCRELGAAMAAGLVLGIL